jgi:hypothetical protein
MLVRFAIAALVAACAISARAEIVDSAPSDTKVELIYAVGGYRQGGADKNASVVDGVAGDQVSSLRAHVETGKPVVAK